MHESGKSDDDRPNVQEKKTGYWFEWMVLFLTCFTAVCLSILNCRVTPRDSHIVGLFSSIAMLSFAMVVIAIIDARKHDRANFHNAIIKNAETDRAKFEKEAEDKKCEMATKKMEQTKAIFRQPNGMVTIAISCEPCDEVNHTKNTETSRQKPMDSESEHVDNG